MDTRSATDDLDGSDTFTSQPDSTHSVATEGLPQIKPELPQLLDRLRAEIHLLRYSPRTEEVYVDWVRRFLLFHGPRRPQDLGAGDITQFLSWLAAEREVSAATQNQARAALRFFYAQVLKIELPPFSDAAAPRVPRRLPVVLAPAQVRALLNEMSGVTGLLTALLYGTGLRLLEALRLRVRDVDFERRELTVRPGQGGQERVTVLPQNLVLPLQRQLAQARALHAADLQAGFGAVEMPKGLAQEIAGAARAWEWQWVFPSPQRTVDLPSGIERRQHLGEQALQKAISAAARRAGIEQACTPQVLRHSFAAQLLQSGHELRTVQALLGHADLKTTLVYTRVLQRGGHGVRSPLDAL